jgi:Asp-tRNA(Asn)/Glu-tRNA(Gln) amidotransferase A subunit family amidase
MTIPLSGAPLPVGLQLIGRPFDEARLLDIAQFLEEHLSPTTNLEKGEQ